MNLVGVTVLCFFAFIAGGVIGIVYGAKLVHDNALKYWRELADQRAERILDLTRQLDQVTNMVECPVCKGSGELHTRSDNTCQCCYGHGSISVAQYNAIQQLGRDIAKRMKERGIDL